VRHHEEAVAADSKLANDGGLGPFEDLDDNAIGAAVVSFVTIYSNLHLSEWEWWLPVTGGIACMLWLGLPSGRMRLEGLPRSFRAAPISALPSQVMVGAAR